MVEGKTYSNILEEQLILSKYANISISESDNLGLFDIQLSLNFVQEILENEVKNMPRLG